MNKKQNIVIFGCRKITIDIIQHIIDYYSDDCNIRCVISLDKDSDKIYGSIPVKEFCNNRGIKNMVFEKEIDKNIISSFSPDLILSFYYRKILKKQILDIPKMGCINIHPALLPKGRGPAPTLWNILNGDRYGGTTMHYMVEGVDAGDIIDQKNMDIGALTGFELNVRLMDIGVQLFKDNFQKILENNNNRMVQNNADATYCLPYVEYLRYICWDYPIKILNQIRAFAKPFDGAMATIKKDTAIILWEAKILEKRESLRAPGFFEFLGDKILVQTCGLPLLITKFDVVGGSISKSGRFDIGPIII